MSDGDRKILLPEPEGHPATKIAFDRPGMFVVAAGDPEDVMAKISDWLIDDACARASNWLPFTDVRFGSTYYLTAHALRQVTSVERTWVIDTSGPHHSLRVPRPAFSELLVRPPDGG